MIRPRIVAGALILLATTLVGAGCSKDQPSSAASSGNPTLPTPSGKCSLEGETAQCAVELGMHDGIVDCAPGTMTCHDGYWSSCFTDGSKPAYSVVAPEPTSSPAPSGELGGSLLHGLTVGGSSTSCTDNPCNPYCQNFQDSPDAALTGDSTTSITGYGWPSLATSNVPPGFQSKGNDPANSCSGCTSTNTTQVCQEACQFDMHCGFNGTNGCVAFDPAASGACTGIDITAPPTCSMASGDRHMTVCNRGTVAAPPGVKCYVFPGNSPQFPDNNPDMTKTILAMTTATTIQPGTCESQNIPSGLFPNGTRSVMCNPPAAPSTTTTDYFPTATVSAGSWVSTTNAYAADGVNTTLPLATTSAVQTATANTNGGWTNPTNAYGTTANSTYATATPAAVLSTSTKLPTASTAGSWTSASNSYSKTDSGASASVTLTPGASSATSLPGASTYSDGTSNTATGCVSGSCASWNNPQNVYGSGVAAVTPGRNDNSIFFVGGFPFGAIPANATITQIDVSVTWSQSATDANNTGGIGIYGGSATGGSGLGKELAYEFTNSNLTTTTGTQTFSVTAAQIAAAHLNVTDVTGAKFVRVRGGRNNSAAGATIFVDDVAVRVTYTTPTAAQQTLVLKNFGFGIPSGDTIASLSINVKMKGSASEAAASISYQAYTGATPIGTAKTVTNPSTTLTVDTSTPSITGLTDTSFSDANFSIQVTAALGTNTILTSWTASIDYVEVSVTYNTGATPSTLVFQNFGFGSIPATATIESVTTEARWKVDTANNSAAVLGVQAYIGGGATGLGSELTTPAAGPPTSDTTVSYTVNSGVTPADLTDANFQVKLRATLNAGGTAFTASVDYVKVTVVYSTYLSSTVTYGNFGISIPAGATISSVVVESKWNVSAANGTAVLSLQPFAGASALTTAVTSGGGGTSPPTTATVVQDTINAGSVTSTSLADGTFTVQVGASRSANSTTTPTTATVDYVKVTVSYTTATSGSLTECNQNNNWTVTKDNPVDSCTAITSTVYAPFTQTRVFDGVCPSGSQATWRLFGYDSTEPSDSKIAFRFRSFAPTNGVCVALTPVTSGSSPAALVTAQSTPTNTQNCATTQSPATASCPVDLYTGLGGLPKAQYECLQMDAYGSPSTDLKSAPTLTDWKATYDCVPSQ